MRKQIPEMFKQFDLDGKGFTQVRYNLATEPYYEPYCGNNNHIGLSRAHWDGEQFKCVCGWRSEFPAEFIKAYKAYRATW